MNYMNTPNLNCKPSWANYWAQDENGFCVWYENKPECVEAVRGRGAWIGSGGAEQFSEVLPLDSYGWNYSLLQIVGSCLIRVRPLHD